MIAVELALGLGAGVLLLAVVAVRVSTRVGMPSLLLYLGIGLLLGEDGIGIDFEDTELTQNLGIAALVVILAEGGLSTKWSVVRPATKTGLGLSTISVIVSIGVTGLGLWWLLDLEPRTAFLWAAVLSSTDAAAVFSVLRNVKVPGRLAGALELESGINDAPVYIAVVVLASDDDIHWWLPSLAVYELAFGAAVGVGFGLGGAWALRRSALPATGLYPLATLAVCVLAFALAQGAHASGFLATYVAGVILGNARLPHRRATQSFVEGLGWLAQIGLFVLLGLYASPSNFDDVIGSALVAAAVLVLVARPLSVVAGCAPFRMPWRHQAFVSWAGLRGAVPIVLALIPLNEGFDDAQELVDVVFVIVVLLTILQGATLSTAARMLRLDSPELGTEIEVDAAPLGDIAADLIQVKVPPDSRLHGVYLSELRLPTGATVSLVVRDGKGFAPKATSRLEEGDQLLVVATAAVRSSTEQRIRAVHRAGRFAKWRGESGEPAE